MHSRGLSLVEMMVVIAIVATLATIGAIFFQKYQKHYRVEAQTRLLFTELLKARTQAIYQRKSTRVKLYTDRFEIYSSAQDGSTMHPVQTHLLPYPVAGGDDLDLVNGGKIDFDETGVTYDWGSICVESDSGMGGVDSIVVSTTRVGIGKKDKGNECLSRNITLK